jgi:ABC-2 type transport system permease protein
VSVATARTVPLGDGRTRRTGVGAVYRVELVKITSQLLPRLAAAVCLIGPFAFAVFMNTQSSFPGDTLFGRWIHTSGFAIPFVTLGFAGIAGFPLLASVVAGDIFSSEDGHGTWKTVLTRSCTRSDFFAGKCLAAATYTTGMVAVLAVSSTAAGLLVTGGHQLIGLTGQVIQPGRALVLVAESFAIVLVPTLAFMCLGILFSVGLRNSIGGVLGPPVVGLLMVVLSLVASGIVVRILLPTTTLEAWHGLLVAPARLTPIWLGALVCVAVSLLCLDSARRSFRRRDFAGEGRAPLDRRRLGRAALVGLAIAAALGVGAAVEHTWITAHRIEASLTPTFENLLTEQQRLLGHPEATKGLLVFPFCKRESVVLGTGAGPGDDWDCHVFVNGPNFRGLAVDYTLTVKPDGCYTADGPPSVVGSLHIRKAGGGRVVNPLYAFDACMIVP